MRAIKILAVPLLAGCLFLACDETSSPTAVSETDAVELQANFMNGPAESGVVMRYESQWWAGDEFPETPAGVSWYFQMGLGPDDHANGCHADMLTPWDAQEVLAKKGEKAIYNEVNKGAGVTVFLWDDVISLYMEAFGLIAEGEDIDPYCYWYERLAPVAGGIATLHYNENPDGMRYIANGTIVYMGETYKFHWLLKDPYTDKMLLKKRIW